MSRLLYFSPVEWTSFAQRPHKFVEWFHDRTKGRVVWVDPYPTRLPRFGDLLRPRENRSQQANATPDWLELIRPAALPIEPLPFGSDINGILCWRECLSRINSFLSAGKTLIAVGKPSQLASDVLNRHSQHTTLYDAMDDFPAFYSGLSRASMRRRETHLSRKVDHLWASSTPLFEHWRQHHANVELVKNALDPKTIEGIGPERSRSSRRVFGYVGTIAAWFDWAWIMELARIRPADEVRLIGPVSVRVPQSIPPNMCLLPPCSHKDAIKEMARFDVGLIPFRRNHLTASVDPIKYYEYRALGLPVISTDFGEMSYRKSELGVFIGGCDAVASLVADSLSFRAIDASGRAFSAENSWQARFDETSVFKNLLRKI